MSGFRKCVRAVYFWQKVLMMTREDLDALGVELMAADDAVTHGGRPGGSSARWG
jgi:hypothetical protein